MGPTTKGEDPRIYLERARRAVASARQLIALGDMDGACNRAFYAVFDASRAALYDANVPPSKTHRGMIGQFGAQLVQTGKVDRQLGRDLNWAEQVRLYADYAAAAADRQTAQDMLKIAETFVAAIDRHLSN
ncbi:MAG: HEPN domain-containing protein [Rhodovibrio sp.]|nr:HEPN domain-containing protein [Rhodovibrio sp.]